MKMPTLEQIRTNRNVLFWSLHAAGWAAYGITQYFGALLYEKPSSYARVIAVAAISGFILSMPMRYIYRRLWGRPPIDVTRSEEHTSELQSHSDLVCRLLLEKKKKKISTNAH